MVGDWLLEADEDAAGDADDEDEAQDDEGGHNDQDHQAVILLRSAEASITISYSWVHLNINGKNNWKYELLNCIKSMLYFESLDTLDFEIEITCREKHLSSSG